MANNYTQFSVNIPLSPETVEWVRSQEADEDREEQMCGFDIYYENDSVVICSFDGDEEQAIDFIQDILAEERVRTGNDEHVLFEAAFVCSKARPGEFGGAKWLIFSDAVYVPEETSTWIARVKKERKNSA